MLQIFSPARLASSFTRSGAQKFVAPLTNLRRWQSSVSESAMPASDSSIPSFESVGLEQQSLDPESLDPTSEKFSTDSLVKSWDSVATEQSQEEAPKKWYATGRRKTSVAQVWIYPGSGVCTVNGKSFVQYFQPAQRREALEPFNVSNTSCMFNVYCMTRGGGISGQAGAVRLGISRALQTYNKELRSPLKRVGFLTRDPRMVERKKAGLRKARRAYQWVKR